MKIIFICGSLESGCDGVGDYTIRLAAQLIIEGHVVQAIALHDKYLENEKKYIEYVNGVKLPILRLSSNLSWSARLATVRRIIKLYSPDWVSLQYVPYAYQRNGIPFRLATFLKKINNRGKWHVMIHEPYLAKQKSLKNKLISLLQNISLRLIIKSITPALVHTSIKEYQRLLSEISIKSSLLGLFGNIPIARDSLRPNKQLFEKKKFTGIYFGAAPALKYHTIFAQKLRAFCQTHKGEVGIIFCGRSGRHGQQFTEAIERACGEFNCDVVSVGELEPHVLSKLFLESNFGISRVPPIFAGKSGSAISMLEHALPLWFPLQNSRPVTEYIEYKPELCYYDLTDICNLHGKNKCAERLPFIAHKLIREFSEFDSRYL